jgi:hypothetical protein
MSTPLSLVPQGCIRLVFDATKEIYYDFKQDWIFAQSSFIKNEFSKQQKNKEIDLTRFKIPKDMVDVLVHYYNSQKETFCSTPPSRLKSKVTLKDINLFFAFKSDIDFINSYYNAFRKDFTAENVEKTKHLPKDQQYKWTDMDIMPKYGQWIRNVLFYFGKKKGISILHLEEIATACFAATFVVNKSPHQMKLELVSSLSTTSTSSFSSSSSSSNVTPSSSTSFSSPSLFSFPKEGNKGNMFSNSI